MSKNDPDVSKTSKIVIKKLITFLGIPLIIDYH